MTDIHIKGIGKKIIPDKYQIEVKSNKAAKVINDYFDSSVMKGSKYTVSHSYFAELDNISKIANLNVKIDLPSDNDD